MKILFHLSFLFLFFVAGKFCYGQTGTQTEEYAILNVLQEGKRNYISVTIGSQKTEEKQYDIGKIGQLYDMSLVISKMTELNKMGYTLFSTSNGVVPIQQGSTGVPFFTFVFVKKK
ncbi:MAG: hypothetical protein JWO58_2428 [Chitinophagaceae bacterium]|nr:hypothetical protein [Chitinophagaceae bacterium]